METYKIRQGDTLGALSKQFKVPIDALTTANKIDNPNKIRAGNYLTIPDPGFQDQPAPTSEPPKAPEKPQVAPGAGDTAPSPVLYRSEYNALVDQGKAPKNAVILADPPPPPPPVATYQAPQEPPAPPTAWEQFHSWLDPVHVLTGHAGDTNFQPGLNDYLSVALMGMGAGEGMPVPHAGIEPTGPVSGLPPRVNGKFLRPVGVRNEPPFGTPKRPPITVDPVTGRFKAGQWPEGQDPNAVPGTLGLPVTTDPGPVPVGMRELPPGVLSAAEIKPFPKPYKQSQVNYDNLHTYGGKQPGAVRHEGQVIDTPVSKKMNKAVDEISNLHDQGDYQGAIDKLQELKKEPVLKNDKESQAVIKEQIDFFKKSLANKQIDRYNVLMNKSQRGALTDTEKTELQGIMKDFTKNNIIEEHTPQSGITDFINKIVQLPTMPEALNTGNEGGIGARLLMLKKGLEKAMQDYEDSKNKNTTTVAKGTTVTKSSPKKR